VGLHAQDLDVGDLEHWASPGPVSSDRAIL